MACQRWPVHPRFSQWHRQPFCTYVSAMSLCKSPSRQGCAAIFSDIIKAFRAWLCVWLASLIVAWCQATVTLQWVGVVRALIQTWKQYYYLLWFVPTSGWIYELAHDLCFVFESSVYVLWCLVCNSMALLYSSCDWCIYGVVLEYRLFGCLCTNASIGVFCGMVIVYMCMVILVSVGEHLVGFFYIRSGCSVHLIRLWLHS